MMISSSLYNDWNELLKGVPKGIIVIYIYFEDIFVEIISGFECQKI